MGGGHAWCKQGVLVRQIIEKKPIGKIPLGRPGLRRENCVKNDIKAIELRTRWSEGAENKDGWQDLYLTV